MINSYYSCNEIDKCRYIQKTSEIYFRGQGSELYCTDISPAYFILKNPKDSGVNIVLDNCAHTNLSGVPVRMAAHYRCSDFPINEAPSKSVISVYTCSCPNIKPKGEIYSINIDDIPSIKHCTFAVPPFNNVPIEPLNGIFIPPGALHIIRFTALVSNERALVSETFGWSETPIKKPY